MSPVRGKVNLTGKRTIVVLPFIVVSRNGDEPADHLHESSLDVEAEFKKYLLRLIRRETSLKVMDTGRVDFPTYDLDILARERDFWLALGERTQGDLIVAGSVDFDVQDRTGYRTEDYASPFDGRTYQRQILVESAGFEYDIVFKVFDGRTGEELYTDNFKDVKQIVGGQRDITGGMFANLMALEDRITNVFTQRVVKTTRTLLGGR